MTETAKSPCEGQTNRKDYTMKTSEIIEKLQARKDRSAWDRGVTQYAIEIVEHCGKEELDGKTYYEDLLCGADDWRDYSFGACSLVCDGDIARRLCTPARFEVVTLLAPFFSWLPDN